MNQHVVNWGNLGYREKYEELLSYKLRVGAAMTLFFLVGTLFTVRWAFESTASTAMLISTAVFVGVLILLSLILSNTNRQIRGIEIFLGFFENRHEVRHQVMCKHHVYCMILHYFTFTTRPKTETNRP